MRLANLGYVGFDVRDLQGWRKFAEQLLGMEVRDTVAPDAKCALALRMDERAHRILLRQGEQDGNAWFGFELANAGELDAARGELEGRGIATVAATPAELEYRRVEAMFHIADPHGYRLEFYHGLADGAAFSPARPVSGFRTGELGFGHVVLMTQNIEPARDFYCGVLGFRVSDYILEPNRRMFMHINGRHHSVAFAERPGLGVAHIMVEVNHLDDLGRAYDVALRDCPERITSTLGRHSNDHVVSFYVESPSGLVVEVGWGGVLVDDATWEVKNVFGPSFWGHDRVGQPAQARQAADAQRKYAFDRGIGAPIQVRSDPEVFALDRLDSKDI